MPDDVDDVYQWRKDIIKKTFVELKPDVFTAGNTERPRSLEELVHGEPPPDYFLLLLF